MLTGVISAAAWFTLFVAAQIAAFRLLGVRHRSKLIVRLFGVALVGHISTVTCIGFAWPSSPGLSAPLSASCGVLLMLCLVILYMPFFYTLTTSLSVETLSMLEAAPGHRLPVACVRQRFTSEEFVLERLETMRANGYFIEEGKAYALTIRGRRVAAALSRVKAILALGPGG